VIAIGVDLGLGLERRIGTRRAGERGGYDDRAG
jgi:hypothetical protein